MSEPAVTALFGAAGKMGREILRLAAHEPTLVIRYGYDTKRAGEMVEGTTLLNLPLDLPADVKLVIDFSFADAVLDHLDLALRRRAAFLTGVTGLAAPVMDALGDAAKEIPVLASPNMSVGMNMMFKLAALTTTALPDHTRQITETHHTAKKDSPSGTALRLAEATGKETPITSLRMGDVVGEHTLVFGGAGERLEITHRADSRAVFAAGTLRAARWLLRQKPGFYNMGDVLGFNDER